MHPLGPSKGEKPIVVVLLLTVTALAALWVPASAQTATAGYVDPEPALRAAEAAIGADRLRCVTIAGRATSGMVGQQRLHGFEVDRPRGAPLTSYSRTMNWNAATMIESFDREPGRNPASWKWGLWWRGGTPLQQHSRQVFAVNVRFA